MPFKLPWSNFHELNLDWVLDKIKELEDTLAGITGSADPSNDPPEMDGTADPGSSANYSRGNHVHPTDTTRASQSYAESIERKVDDLDHDCEVNFREIYDILNFSTASPLVDGEANPGASQYPARADHVHPTDTSRASATDLTYLAGRVDAMLQSNNLVVETLDFGDISTSANTYRASVNAYKAGYTFLGFLGYRITDATSNGQGASTCHVYEMAYTTNNEAQIAFAQSGNTTINIHLSAQVLYVAIHN